MGIGLQKSIIGLVLPEKGNPCLRIFKAMQLKFIKEIKLNMNFGLRNIKDSTGVMI